MQRAILSARHCHLYLEFSESSWIEISIISFPTSSAQKDWDKTDVKLKSIYKLNVLTKKLVFDSWLVQFEI